MHCVSADATSAEALQVMAEEDVGAVPVVDGDCLIGIISGRDYARSALQDGGAGVTLREVMTPCNVSADIMDSVQECFRLLDEHSLRFLPVQEAGKMIALLPIDEFLEEMVAYLTRVIKENELDQQLVFLRGTYSC